MSTLIEVGNQEQQRIAGTDTYLHIVILYLENNMYRVICCLQAK